jgi:hypothetical protein
VTTTSKTTTKKKLVLDRDKTKVRLRTFAEGLFARLAHDLELECRGLTGAAEIDPDTRAGTARIVAPIEKIDVLGTLSKDKSKVDPQGLSPSDREDCLGKMRKDVFHATTGNVIVEAKIDTGKARVTITTPNGKSITTRAINLATDDATSVTGTLEVSLSAMGSDTVKGPMNAFRVKDIVEIVFDVTFVTFVGEEEAAAV